MTSYDLAKLVADHLNETEDKPRPFLAFRPKKKAEAVAETGKWTVAVISGGEDETPLDNNDACDCRLRVRVVVNGPVKDLGEGLELSYFIRQALRLTRFDRFDWQGNQVTELWDEEAIDRGQFLSLFEAEYFDIQ